MTYPINLLAIGLAELVELLHQLCSNLFRAFFCFLLDLIEKKVEFAIDFEERILLSVYGHGASLGVKWK
jgi:hypothetical protein